MSLFHPTAKQTGSNCHAETSAPLSPLATPLSSTKGKAKYFAILLLVCAVAFASISLIFFLRGRSLIWELDGKNLYYTFFVYEGEMLRSIVSSFITTGTFDFSTFSFNSGFGYDSYLLLAGHITDPLNLFSALCPPEYAEYLYEFLVFVRFFFAACTFSLYCFSRGKSKQATMCAALCYSLCGYIVLLAAFRHAFFINFAILLPLLFMGADRLFAGKSPWLFIASMAVSFIYSVYTSYMGCLFLFVYCLLTYFFFPRSRGVKDFLALVLKFVGCIVTALMASGLFSFPVVATLLSMDRVGMVREIPFFQTESFYDQMVANFAGGSAGLYCSIVGIVPVFAMLAVLAGGKTIPKPERRSLLVALALCVVGICVAYVGSVMNGFGYSTDRWQIVWGFCGAYAVVLALPALRTFQLKNWLAYAAAAATLLAILLATPKKTLQFWAIFAIATIIALVVFIATAAAWLRRKRAGEPVAHHRKGAYRALCATTALAVIVSSAACYNITLSRHGYGTITTFMRSGTLHDYTHSILLDGHLDALDNDYRIDRSNISAGRNVSFGLGYKGMDFYSSFYNQNLDNFRREMGIADNATNFIYNGVQGRYALDALLGARYFVATESTLDTVPYGYKRIADLGESINGNTYYLYESSDALPLAFTYDTAISQDAYENLSPVEKQEILTKACVIDKEMSAAVADVNPLTTQISEATIVGHDGLTIKDGSIVVTKSDATLQIQTEGQADCENYVCLEGLFFNPMSSDNAAALAADTSPTARSESYEESPGFKPAGSSRITITGSESERSFTLLSPFDGQYGAKSEWIVNMGYSQAPQSTYTITFGEVGEYLCLPPYVAHQPIADIQRNIEDLLNRNTASIDFSPAGMSVELASTDNTKDARYLFLSIPYSAGWSASIDGDPVSILRANTGFMAIEADGEAHTVQFSYETPGMRIGAICTALSVIALIGLAAYAKRRRKEAHATPQELA